MDEQKTPSAIQLKFWTDQSTKATVLQLVLVILLILAFIFCLATIVEFLHQHNKLNTQQDDECPADDDLEISIPRDQHYKKQDNHNNDDMDMPDDDDNADDQQDYEKDCYIYYGRSGNTSYCRFVISGHVIVALGLVTMFILLLLIMFIRVCIDRVIGIILVLVSILVLLLSSIASIVLSAGFTETCKTLSNTMMDDMRMPDDMDRTVLTCSEVYTALQSSTAMSWIETVLLGIICIVSFLYLGLKAFEGTDNTM